MCYSVHCRLFTRSGEKVINALQEFGSTTTTLSRGTKVACMTLSLQHSSAKCIAIAKLLCTERRAQRYRGDEVALNQAIRELANKYLDSLFPKARDLIEIRLYGSKVAQHFHLFLGTYSEPRAERWTKTIKSKPKSIPAEWSWFGEAPQLRLAGCGEICHGLSRQVSYLIHMGCT
jgi:hypothetical protein